MAEDGTLKKRWFPVPAEHAVLKMDGLLENIGPKHPVWSKRVKAEILNIESYRKFIRKQGGIPWFHLVPSKKKAYNFLLWEGYLRVVSRPEIRFDFIILLPATYPTNCPRALIDEVVLKKYKCSKIYANNTYVDKDTKKTYVMICHDHLKEVGEVWTPSLTIAHFLIREVHTWWTAQQNLVLTTYDELTGKKE
ncbi:MAG: hypothetical protein GF308_05515 [Candidatus Heimdallarchaeota archaeon]|nr:hypothetical protein [Candidatus Heimdallarchaeota archaeon]